ncbi:hypothetical protein HJFPF1_00193 [Paramyrothecium foliicola]|nr:hypothetical protein HJFPF1_00193 [Paramyrothecium foliicola]
MVVIEIEVISDFVCVWCYIGKKQLERAISLYQRVYPGGKNDVFSITYRPYFLDYNASSKSVEKSALTEKKLAGMSQEKRKALQSRICQIGQSLGINFSWGGRIGWTRDAHRLVHLARSKPEEVQSKLVEAIFSAYQEQERDIASIGTLREIAVNAGLDAAEVEGWLTTDAGLADLLEEEKRFKELRENTGVPAYRMQGVHILEGSQDPQDLLDLFIKIREGSDS